jgi:hypothetical protein
MLQFLQQNLLNLNQNNYKIVINGDFNFPNILWFKSDSDEDIGSYKFTSGFTNADRMQAEALLKFTGELFLTQMICKPTRGNNILDLLFISACEYIKSVEVSDTCLSDHKLIEVIVDGDMAHTNKTGKVKIIDEKITFRNLNFYNKNIDWDLLCKCVTDENWNEHVKEAQSVQEAKINFDRVLLGHCTQLVPVRKQQSVRSRFHSQRKVLMKKRTVKRSKLLRESVPHRNEQLKKDLLSIENKIIKSHEEERKHDEYKAIENIKTNSKYFFTFAAKFSTSKTKIGPFVQENGEIVDDARQMSEMLNEQYGSVFSTPTANVTEHRNVNEINDIITDIPFTAGSIEDAIDELKLNSSAGPDGIPAVLLKKCKKAISRPLYLLWRKSLDDQDVPSNMKHAEIFPLSKGGSRTSPANYRPVSLTSHVIKIFERVIKKYIVEHLESNSVLNVNQHGFRSKRGTITQLLEHYDTILDALCMGSNVDVIYLDFAKAFDKVDHELLLAKTYNCGIQGKIHKWLETFLKNRTQSVIVDGAISSPLNVISGVPQGTVLGPILFLIMANDLSLSCKYTNISCFADDTRILATIKGEADVRNAQEDLDKVAMWADKNNMKFNKNKFELVRYGKDNKLIKETSYVTENGNKIQEKESLRDLGVRMQNNATFDDHIARVESSGKKWCSWVLRTFRTRQKDTMMLLWKQLILPRIEYCSPLWAPYKRKDLEKLENIQKTFTSKIQDVIGLDYHERLEALEMYSLQRRFERYYIISVWKILEGFTINVNHKIKSTFNPRTGRKCEYKVADTKGGTGLQTKQFNSFAVRGPRLFNKMPAKIRNMANTSIIKFKNVLDGYLACIPDKPLINGYPHLGDNSILSRGASVDKLSLFLSSSKTREEQSNRPEGQAAAALQPSFS